MDIANPLMYPQISYLAAKYKAIPTELLLRDVQQNSGCTVQHITAMNL